MLADESSYICDNCGEEIVAPVDLSAGSEQTYIEDCPVCCHPNQLYLTFDEQGEPMLRSETI